MGNSLKRIPEQKASLWASYAWITNAGRFVAGGSLSYTGAYYTSQLERRLDEVPARQRTDVRVTWTNVRENLRVTAFIDNVFNESSVRGASTGNHDSFYWMTGTLLYPRYRGIDLR